ncbi:MAG: FGGY family carbohydrate kinase, partial [Coriobacteriia bacterium]|nr:FGGY family carbohydrate kinase [Coriobacteriia bacterium]
MDYIAVFDQGTTSSRCVIFNSDAKVISHASEEIKRFFPRPGWVEQDAMEIWSSQFGMYTKALAKAQLTPHEISAIGITNQRETTVVWDKNTGEPICLAPVWQCRRGAKLVDEWVAAGHSTMIHQKTGLIPDAYFSASKLRWILDNVEGARAGAEAGDYLFGTVDSWLIW